MSTSPGNSAASRDIATQIHPYTNLHAHAQMGPLVMTGGRGVWVQDDSGKSYIEGMAGLWCASLGFGEERLVEAACKQLRALPFYHLFTHKSHHPAIDLSERLLAMAPVPMSKVFLTSSGSEANDTAIKLIWYYNNALGRPAKKKIIARRKAYHGVTIATASLTGLPNNHRDFDLPIPGMLHVECPHYWRQGLPEESEKDFATRLAAELEALILAEGPETIAAFFAEPVMGAGGVIPPPITYFEKVQAVLRRHDILFLADEVICGFGRTGNMFGSETFRIKPDMMTLGKALSSGYQPIAALLVSEPIWQAMVAESAKIGIFGHGFTYGGHPVAAAVALETLKIYEERDIVAQVRAVAPRLQNGLRRFADHPLVGEVRGLGLLGGIELVADKATREPLKPNSGAAPYLVRRAEAHGLITRSFMDSIGFSPPLIIEEAEIDEMLVRFGRALDDTAAWLKTQN